MTSGIPSTNTAWWSAAAPKVHWGWHRQVASLQRRPCIGALPRLRLTILEENAYVCQILGAKRLRLSSPEQSSERQGTDRSDDCTAGFLAKPCHAALMRWLAPSTTASPSFTLGNQRRRQHRGRLSQSRVFPPLERSVLPGPTKTGSVSSRRRCAETRITRFVGTPVGQGPVSPASGGPAPRAWPADQMLFSQSVPRTSVCPFAVGPIWWPTALAACAECRMASALATHYKLLQQVVKGLQTLQRESSTPMRPANVMALGMAPSPNTGSLSDYGSFIERSGQRRRRRGWLHDDAGGHPPPHQRVLARERRAGMEQENADVALIIGAPGAWSQPPATTLSGWVGKTEVIDEQLGRVYPLR